MNKALRWAVGTALALSSVAAFASPFHVTCKDTYAPTIEIKLGDDGVAFAFEDAVADDYRFVTELFKIAKKALPAISPTTRFSLSLVTPLTFPNGVGGQDHVDLTISKSDVLPGWGYGLIRMSAAYHQKAPTVSVYVRVFDGEAELARFETPMLFTTLANAIREVNTEHAGPNSGIQEDMTVELSVRSTETVGGETDSAHLFRAINPFGACKIGD